MHDKPWEFEHQFLYVKHLDDSMLGQDVPRNKLAPPQQLGGEFIRNPLEFATTFYLASQYEASSSLRDLANVVSTVSLVLYFAESYRLICQQHRHGTSETVTQLAEALLEIIPLISLQRESVNTLLASCSR